jgi:hypothetical protein
VSEAAIDPLAVRESVLLLVLLPLVIGVVSHSLGDGFVSGAAFGFGTAVITSALIVLWGPMGRSGADR